MQVVIVIINCCIVIAIIIIAITRDLEKAQAAKDEIEAATKTKVWGFRSHKKPQNLSVKGDDLFSKSCRCICISLTFPVNQVFVPVLKV